MIGSTLLLSARSLVPGLRFAFHWQIEFNYIEGSFSELKRINVTNLYLTNFDQLTEKQAPINCNGGAFSLILMQLIGSYVKTLWRALKCDFCCGAVKSAYLMQLNGKITSEWWLFILTELYQVALPNPIS